MPGSGKSKGKSKGKNYYDKGKGKGGFGGKGEGKGDGSCIICGKPGHWWRECPDRFSPKGRKSGSKGKGQGKTNYIEHDNYSTWVTTAT